MILARWLITSSSSVSSPFICSSAFLTSYFDILFIFISVSLIISSRVSSLFSFGLNGSSPVSIASTTASHVSHSSILRYMRSSMNIFSRDDICHSSSSSSLRISSSLVSRFTALSTVRLSISLTPINSGLLLNITQALGDMDISQSVNA